MLYINVLPRVGTKPKFLLHADDTNIVYENFDPKKHNNDYYYGINMESSLNPINVNKTVTMLFHTRQKRANIDENSIVNDGNIIPFTTNTKFLGNNIDNNLTWKAHMNYITTKISKGVPYSPAYNDMSL